MKICQKEELSEERINEMGGNIPGENFLGGKFPGMGKFSRWHFEKEALPQVFSCEFRGISKNTFFTEHL